MLSKLLKALRENCPRDTARPLLVGFSGGADSLCLVHALHSEGYSMLAAHLDHALRPESGAEAERLARDCRTLGVPFVSERVDAAAYAHAHRTSIEEAARIVRYTFLFRIARQVEACAVAVAHTADDQVETVLMHLLRGAGLSGLKGMAFRSLPNTWSRTIPILRPLLGIWRSEVDAYCMEHRLEPLRDPSNEDRAFTRNRIRAELIPYLEEAYNPAVRTLIWKTAAVLQTDHAFIAGQMDSVWQTILLSRSRDHVVLSLEGFLAQPAAIRRALLRRAASEVMPALRDVGFDQLERALQMIEDDRRLSGAAPLKQCDLTGGLRVYVDLAPVLPRLGIIALPAQESASGLLGRLGAGELPQLSEDRPLALAIPGSLSLGAWSAAASWQPAPPDLRRGQDDPCHLHAWLDLSTLEIQPQTLTLRPRRPAERIRPLGMHGKTMKISDLMVNRKIPRQARGRYPLFCLDDEVMWIPGVCVSETYRVDQKKSAVLHLEIRRSA